MKKRLLSAAVTTATADEKMYIGKACGLSSKAKFDVTKTVEFKHRGNFVK